MTTEFSFLNGPPRKLAVAINNSPQTLSSKYANNIHWKPAAWMLQPAKSKSARPLQTILEFTAERTLNPLSWTHRFKTHALGSDRIGSYQASPASGDMRVLSCNVQSISRQARERERNLQLRDQTQKRNPMEEERGRTLKNDKSANGWMEQAET